MTFNEAIKLMDKRESQLSLYYKGAPTPFKTFSITSTFGGWAFIDSDTRDFRPFIDCEIKPPESLKDKLLKIHDDLDRYGHIVHDSSKKDLAYYINKYKDDLECIF